MSEKIELAWKIARLVHKEKKRRNGEPYLIHIEQTVKILQALRWGDEKTLTTAILHDVIEDMPSPEMENHLLHKMETELGDDIVSNVLILTGDDGETYQTYIDGIIASGKTQVIQVKIADMLQNITDSPTEKQKEKYLEALPKLLKALV